MGAPADLSRNAWLRIAPFAVFIAGLMAQDMLADRGDMRWLYAPTALAVTVLLLLWRREYGELARQNAPRAVEILLALTAGAAVFVAWIHLDADWMRIGQAQQALAPLTSSGELDWPWIAVRALGAALVVPVMEELFWRSFLMRWIVQARFETVAPQRVGVRALLLSTFVFTLAHSLWLAAALAGLVYGLLYILTGRLWVSVLAHAVTNALLALHVVRGGQWQFW